MDVVFSSVCGILLAGLHHMISERIGTAQGRTIDRHIKGIIVETCPSKCFERGSNPLNMSLYAVCSQ